jgi:hypothetical protein
MIQRVAPLTGEQLREKETALDERKATWGHNKRLSRASRAKRREFW